VAWFLRGAHRRISKNHDKEGYGKKDPVLGTNAAVGEGKCFEKLHSNFFPTIMGVLRG
jgi:hypothetical protein